MIINEVDLPSLKENEVLFFIRIRGKNSYFKDVYNKKFLSEFKKIKHFRCISEYKKDADVYIDLNTISRDYLLSEELPVFDECVDIHDVIARCRGLRNISYIQAKALIVKAFLFFNNFYKENLSLKVIVMGTIDNYIMDIMVRTGRKKGIAFIGLTNSFMSPEYTLLTTKGELCPVNSLDTAQIPVFINKIKNNLYAQRKPKWSAIIKKFLYNFCSAIYRYCWRYIIKHKLQGRLEYEYRFAKYFHSINIFDQLYGLLFLEKKLSKKTNKICYIPLHFYPEATTDYWVHDLHIVDYYNSFQQLVITLQKNGYTVVTKEHPDFILRRSSKFYAKLRKLGCTIYSPFISTKEIFDISEIVVVYNGSTGIEGIVENKKVYRFSNSYYGDGIIPTVAQLNSPYSEINIADVLSRVLASSFKT